VQAAGFGAALLVSGSGTRLARANPLGRPVGVQLYTVNQAMAEDPAGTLNKLAEIGFREAETAGFGNLTAGEFRRLLDDAGLACPSAHLQFDPDNLGRAFEEAHVLGAGYATSSSLIATRPMTLDTAKRNAELANRIGAGARKAGLQFVYHNHDFEFADLGAGDSGYDLLLRETDPQLVKFEIDCGWMVFAGRNPIDYFHKYPGRFPMIHVKDFLPPPQSGAAPGGTRTMSGAELGRGVVDYKPIFAAAQSAGVQHYFAEQEGPFSRMSQLRAAQVAYDYLHRLN
jgi:sugar phosphate isomerase/epimerase